MLIEKVHAISQCKEDIKNAINSKGGEVLETTPLADYADAILGLQGGEGIVEVDDEGNVVWSEKGWNLSSALLYDFPHLFSQNLGKMLFSFFHQSADFI